MDQNYDNQYLIFLTKDHQISKLFTEHSLTLSFWHQRNNAKVTLTLDMWFGKNDKNN